MHAKANLVKVCHFFFFFGVKYFISDHTQTQFHNIIICSPVFLNYQIAKVFIEI